MDDYLKVVLLGDELEQLEGHLEDIEKARINGNLTDIEMEIFMDKINNFMEELNKI